MKLAEFSELLGKTLKRVVYDPVDEEIHFVTDDGQIFKLYHSQECCEDVSVESIVGELDDLVGTPITLAEEASCTDDKGHWGDDSFTWTFYKLATIKGYVDIRWYGSSNGYYSESVYFAELP